MRCRTNRKLGRGVAGHANRKARFAWLVPFVFMAGAAFYIVAYHFVLPYGPQNNSEGQMMIMPPLDVAHDRGNDEEGRMSTAADAPGEDGPFFWEKAKNCRAVEDVCLVQGEINRWFYFTREDGGGVNEQEKRKKQPKQQPSISLHLAKEYDYSRHPAKGWVKHVHFDVSSVTLPKPTLSQMKMMPYLEKCSLSKIDNHVVIQSAYNWMIGEFYTRSLLPLSQMMTMITKNNRSSSIDIDDDSAAKENLQFYVHLLNGAKLLDSHILFLSGLASNHKARDWQDMFVENHKATTSDDDPLPECECYRRFVLCGYRRLADNAPTCTLPGIENVMGLSMNATATLCDKGINLSMMKRLNNESLVDKLLQKAGIFTDSERLMIIGYVNNANVNVALHQPNRASSAVHLSKLAFDDNESTMWRSDDKKDDQFLEVDLEELHRVEKVVIVWGKDTAHSYDIQTSVDRVQWTTAWSKNSGSKVRETGRGTVIESPIKDVTCQYVRMQGHKPTSYIRGRYSIFEMQVYGAKLNTSSLNPVDFDLSGKTTLVVDGNIYGGTSCHESVHDLKYAGCESYASLKKELSNKFLTKYPDLSNDIAAYRLSVLRDTMRTLPTASQTSNTTNHREWTFIGLTQRKKRRSWLNLNEVVAHCNKRYHNYQILCVEVNIEKIASSSKGGGDGGHDYEQLVMHRSMSALIGVHGAQLTQGVLLPPGATVVELLPWAPQGTFFPGRNVNGGWVQRRDKPTPLGIIYHNTDLNHAGYPLGRDSVPLCQNVSHTVMHKFAKDGSRNETELEYCLLDTFARKFIWEDRDFTVEIKLIDRFISTFILHKKATETGTFPLCSDLRKSGEKNNFVLYNVWCKEDNITSNVSVQHYYQDKK